MVGAVSGQVIPGSALPSRRSRSPVAGLILALTRLDDGLTSVGWLSENGSHAEVAALFHAVSPAFVFSPDRSTIYVLHRVWSGVGDPRIELAELDLTARRPIGSVPIPTGNIDLTRQPIVISRDGARVYLTAHTVRTVPGQGFRIDDPMYEVPVIRPYDTRHRTFLKPVELPLSQWQAGSMYTFAAGEGSDLFVAGSAVERFRVSASGKADPLPDSAQQPDFARNDERPSVVAGLGRKGPAFAVFPSGIVAILDNRVRWFQTAEPAGTVARLASLSADGSHLAVGYLGPDWRRLHRIHIFETTRMSMVRALPCGFDAVALAFESIDDIAANFYMLNPQRTVITAYEHLTGANGRWRADTAFTCPPGMEIGSLSIL